MSGKLVPRVEYTFDSIQHSMAATTGAMEIGCVSVDCAFLPEAQKIIVPPFRVLWKHGQYPSDTFPVFISVNGCSYRIGYGGATSNTSSEHQWEARYVPCESEAFILKTGPDPFLAISDPIRVNYVEIVFIE